MNYNKLTTKANRKKVKLGYQRLCYNYSSNCTLEQIQPKTDISSIYMKLKTPLILTLKTTKIIFKTKQHNMTSHPQSSPC